MNVFNQYVFRPVINQVDWSIIVIIVINVHDIRISFVLQSRDTKPKVTRNTTVIVNVVNLTVRCLIHQSINVVLIVNHTVMSIRNVITIIRNHINIVRSHTLSKNFFVCFVIFEFLFIFT